MSTRILHGDCRAMLPTLPAASVQCCVTSPPYFGLRDYGVAGQIGLEPTPDEYVAEMVAVFREVKRVLRDDGCLWLNLGDSYANGGAVQSTPTARGGRFGSAGGVGRQEKASEQITVRRPDGWSTGCKPKDLIGIPWMVAFALRADGWYLRSDCIWHKPNPMPESCNDRPTKAHEYVFLLTKSARYFYDSEAVKEPATEVGTPMRMSSRRAEGMGVSASGNETDPTKGIRPATRNLRTVWTIATTPFSGSHFATMPPDLAERCIKAGSRPGDTVLDPFSGAGTTALVADRLNRNAVGIELNPSYAAMGADRVRDDAPLFAEVSL